MPLPPPNLAPYHTLEGVLNTARVRLNDAIQQLSGDILKDSQPFTQQMANSAWLRLQQFLELADLALFLADQYFRTVDRDHGDTAGVIPAIFEAT